MDMRNLSVFSNSRYTESFHSVLRRPFMMKTVFASLLLTCFMGVSSAFALPVPAGQTSENTASEDSVLTSSVSDVSESVSDVSDGSAAVSSLSDEQASGSTAAVSYDSGSASLIKTEADKLYQENNFTGAIEKYESVLSSGLESAVIYYNLGNSYYKNKNIAKAVLNYERALLLSPGDEDIRYNLEMAKSKTIDKITPKSEVFIVTWANGLRDMMSESAWAKASIFCFIVFLLSVSAYIFGSKILIKKVGFSLAIVFLLFTVVGNMFADAQKDKLMNRTGAIIMTPSVTVKSTPDDSGTDLFVLHEGTKVFIDDNSMKGWKEVCLEDGSKGWVPASSIEQI